MINKTMSKPFTTQQFIESANKKFNSKFDYSMVHYKNANTHVTILCPDHGEFSTTPWTHLSRKHGCPKCGINSMARGQKEITHQKFNNFIQINPHDYDYSLAKFDVIHDKIRIICKHHGEFVVTVDSHMRRGTGCKKCADQNKTGGYNNDWFNFDPSRKELPGLLYVLEMYSNTERFIKVGMTKNTVKQRYAGSKYQYNILKIFYLSLYDCYQLETSLKQNFKSDLYLNSQKILITESFKFNSKDKILKYLTLNSIK